VDDQFMGVPLGLVAISWLRQFKLILQENLPQMPNNVGLEGLGFVKDLYRRIDQISPLDFRVAARFTGQEALFVHQAIPEAVSNIKQMPETYTSFPDGLRVYGITPGRSPRIIRELVLDADYLRSFGELLVPESIWRALTRLNVWIEPALVAEWIRIMKDYLIGQRREIDEQALYRATRWADPERDVRVARDLAVELLRHSAIPQLGFVRVSVQRMAGRLSVSEAANVLAGMIDSLGRSHEFLADNVDCTKWPAWCRSATRTTDAHLLSLAGFNQAKLATLDAGIPGAFLLPFFERP
jgi:hypothetical protein